jgi:hypothetical protein
MENTFDQSKLIGYDNCLVVAFKTFADIRGFKHFLVVENKINCTVQEVGNIAYVTSNEENSDHVLKQVRKVCGFRKK